MMSISLGLPHPPPYSHVRRNGGTDRYVGKYRIFCGEKRTTAQRSILQLLVRVWILFRDVLSPLRYLARLRVLSGKFGSYYGRAWESMRWASSADNYFSRRLVEAGELTKCSTNSARTTASRTICSGHVHQYLLFIQGALRERTIFYMACPSCF